MTQGRVLIVDDEREIAELLGYLLHNNGLTPMLANDGTTALQMVRAGDPDVLLADIRMPGMDGLELLCKVRDLDPDLPVILTTGFAGVRGAVEAIRAGAHDYLAKPFDHLEVIRVVRRALNERRLKLEMKHLREHLRNVIPMQQSFGSSEKVRNLIAAVERVAKSDFSVIIIGETGSGKELVASAIHQGSPRSSGPFVAVDCGAIPESLLESELFGHEKGAFTGADQAKPGKIESARGGTLFLDEISNMGLAFQAKLLRVLQERTLCRLGSNKPIAVDVRLLAASNSPLDELCQAGSFRRDLFFRLNDYMIPIPPLRQRQEDIMYLARRFMDMTNMELGKSIRGFAPTASEAMLAYDWPGNVRQLRSVVRRAVLVSDGVISAEHLNIRTQVNLASLEHETTLEHGPGNGEYGDLPLREILRRYTTSIECKVITHTLQRTGGNKARAARLLGLDYKTLHSKTKTYGIHTEGERTYGHKTQREKQRR